MRLSLTSTLTQIAHSWLDPNYPLRQQALDQAASEFCLSAPSFKLALEWIFSLWTETKINSFIQKNPYQQNRYAAQILACTTPAMIAQGFLQGAILNIPQCLKIPSKQPCFAQLLHQSFAEHSAELAQLFELCTGQDDLSGFYAKLKQADLVFAYGRDETMATLRQQISPQAIFVAHGHVESAAIIFKEAAQEEALLSLAYDMLSYDQRGCLSPRLVLIEEGGERSPAEAARRFAEIILPPLAQQLPRGGLYPGEATEILHQRSVYGFRGPVYCGADWTVCYSEKQDWPQTVLPRFMPILPFDSHQQLIKILAPIKERLISLGCAGPAEKQIFLKQMLINQVVPLGEMQRQVLVF